MVARTVALDLWSLLHWTLCPERLSPSQRDQLEQAERVVVSSSICWQMHEMLETGGLRLAVPLEEFWRRLSRVERVDIVCPEARHWLEARKAPAHLSDLDRLALAVARLEGCPLLDAQGSLQLEGQPGQG